LLKDIRGFEHPDLLVGCGVPDDAGVFRLRPDLALVQTVDFFTPVVDDPYQFGLIAAANALSDIYTMGATPITALNLVAYPVCELGTDTLKAILQGGSDKVAEAGAVLLGGHSVEDDEPKYGLAVTGIVHPDERPASPMPPVKLPLIATTAAATCSAEQIPWAIRSAALTTAAATCSPLPTPGAIPPPASTTATIS
jgi:selenium donor protein